MVKVPGENPVVQELEKNLVQDNMLTEEEKMAFSQAFAKDKYGVLSASRDRQGKLRDFILKDIRTNVEQSIGGEKVRVAQQFFNARNAQKNKEDKRSIPMIGEDAIFGPAVMKEVVRYQEEKGIPVTGILDASLFAQIQQEFGSFKLKPLEEKGAKIARQPRVETFEPVVLRTPEGLIQQDIQIIQGLEKHTLANLRSALGLERSDKPFDAELQREVKRFQEKYNRGEFGFGAIFGRPSPPDKLLNSKGVPDKITQGLIFGLKNPPHIPS